jgi:hypothetical protein
VSWKPAFSAIYHRAMSRSASVRSLPVGAIAFGLLVGTAAFGYVVFRGVSSPVASDFDQLWYGARGAWRGVSPYAVVGPGREFDWDYLFYPMPAVIIAMPFASMPLLFARAAFAGMSACLLGAALWREDRGRLLVFATAPTLIALGRGQASPLLLATAFIPALSWLGTMKPNVALSILPVSKNVRLSVIAGAIGTIVLLAMSFYVEPSWIAQWRDAVSRKDDSTPLIVRFGGFLILLVLLRWRRREAWLVLLLACLPQTPSLYDAVPLFAVPRGGRQTAMLALFGNIAFLALVSGVGFPPAVTYGVRVTTLSLLFIYLPTVGLVLSRPNTAAPETNPRRALTRADLALFATLGISAFFAKYRG